MTEYVFAKAKDSKGLLYYLMQKQRKKFTIIVIIFQYLKVVKWIYFKHTDYQ